jgi:putative hemolysin
MSGIALEVTIVFALLLLNGLFSMAEIAIVSSRKARLRQLADGGDSRARLALELAESPNTFLSTVQIGITLVGVLAAAFSGATMAEELAKPMRRVSWLAPYATQASFAVVVTGLTYFTLVLGELVPKRLGLRDPEGIARTLARPMRKLSKLASPVVALLSLSTEALLRLLRLKPVPSCTVSEEEVRLLVKEGMRAGVFHPNEPAMVESVMALDRLPVRDLMTPRAKIIWINVQDPHEAIWHKIVVSGHTSFPVYEGNRDHVIGVVSVKAIYANLAAGAAVNVKDLMTPALVVPSSMSASSLLEKFKQTRKHVALVTDEFGGVVGLASLHDIMEAIIGELPASNERARPRALRRDDGSWLVDGMIEADEFERVVAGFRLHTGAERDYHTFAGFIVKHLGRVPSEGDAFQLHGYHIEIIDMDNHRVDKVLLLPLNPNGQLAPRP